MTTHLSRTCAGKSHSWLTPTTSLSRPSAKRISVADGRRETTRMKTHSITTSWESVIRRGLEIAGHASHPCRKIYLYRKYFLRIWSKAPTPALHLPTIVTGEVL